jgi:nitrate/TMAO reductase-like tetraheme cytochrome c subunit
MIGMPRRPLVAAGLLLATLAVIGCQSRSGKDQSGPVELEAARRAGVTGHDPVFAPDDGPLFAHWPKDGFQGAIVLSGEQNGYLEPCGCVAGQRGGLARRLDLVDRLRKQGWSLALLDLGSLINDPNTHGGPEETKVRYTFALKALAMLGYGAFALSPSDLQLGVGEVLTQYMNYLEPEQKGSGGVKVLCANIEPEPGLDLAKTLVKTVRIPLGPTIVGATAVIEPKAFEALADPDRDLMLHLRDPAEVLPDALADLQRDTAIQVLLVQGSPEYARKLAADFPGFEVVQSKAEYVEPPLEPESINDGKTWLVNAGKKGQYLAVIGVYQSNDPAKRLRYERIDLNQRYNAKTEAMRKLIDEDFQESLKQVDVLASYPRRPYVFATSAPSQAKYVGALACKECHPKTFEKWSTTKHAFAYEALRINPKRNREFDAECISCHVTGFEYEGGFTSLAATPNLLGNQCENCHGPGSLHALDPKDVGLRQAMHRDKADADKNLRCVACHSEDDSPHFDFATYWPKIEHSKLDSYADPKLYRGLDPARLEQIIQSSHTDHAASTPK